MGCNQSANAVEAINPRPAQPHSQRNSPPQPASARAMPVADVSSRSSSFMAASRIMEGSTEMPPPRRQPVGPVLSQLTAALPRDEDFLATYPVTLGRGQPPKLSATDRIERALESRLKRN